MATTAALRACRRLRLEVSGAVQGVGFRPFLFRTAQALDLRGWIRNDPAGVTVEMEGPAPAIRQFLARVRSSPPPRSVIRQIRESWLPPAGLEGLAIVASDASGERLTAVLPDLATCPACLVDVGLGADLAPEERTAEPDRRRGYAFTNCTDCGPRFSIIRSLPYDRPNTTMTGFTLCAPCRAEYEDPLDRRFHAQPTACPACGPRLAWIAGVGEGLEGDEIPAADPLAAAVSAIRRGEIVAVKGLGGFHLVVDATSEAAVQRLRERKRRATRPLAVMVTGLLMARELCQVPDATATLLAAPEAPIVLLRRRVPSPVAGGVAPGNPYLGIMLPYTPLHHTLLSALGTPVVATSGNLSDEPICIDETEAMDRLGGIADGFLVHDRPIERPVDDSVVHWMDGQAAPVRRSRGYAPLPVALTAPAPPILAVGGHLKNTIGVARGSEVFLSQHVGDLDSPAARDRFQRTVADLLGLLEVTPLATAHDLHPDYASSLWAAASGYGEGIPVQHHHAHLVACLVDNEETGPALGVVWDGSGLGPDGTVWGGEFLAGDAAGYRRVAHFRPFRLPGGEAAVNEPRRAALALLHAAGPAIAERHRPHLAAAFERHELRVLERMLDSGFRSPWTTSAGRLFDGVASLLGLRHRARYEGEAAMALEFAVDPTAAGAYPFPLVAVAGAEAGAGLEAGPMIVDWVPALVELLADAEAGVPTGVVAARFHAGLVAAVLAVAERVGMEQVALTGGCFQNRVLAEGSAASLRSLGHRPLLHRRVPANDGGLALGQVAVAAAVLRQRAGR
jgi:hydrogenase maturation protein HypF